MISNRRILALAIPTLCVVWPGILLLAVDQADFDLPQEFGLIGLGMCATALLVPLAANLRVLWILNLPFAAFSSTYAGYVFEFRQSPSAVMWETIFATDSRELREQLGLHVTFIAIGIAIITLYAAFGLSRTAMQVKIGRTARLASLAASGWLLLVGVGLPSLWQPSSIYYVKVLPIDVLYASYPTGAVITAWQTLVQGRRAALVPVPNVAFVKPSQRRVVILVIGEAEQYFRWRVVAEESSSWLIRPSADLVLFTQDFSQANLTLNSVPMLLTGTSTKATARDAPTWLQYARATGCHTVWLSNNEFIGQGHYDDAVDLERTTYDLNPNGDQVVYDDVLLPELDGVLSQSKSDLCVVLHMMGSHANYQDRYAAAEQRYPVDATAYSNRFSKDFEIAQRAAYMNAVAHSQRVVEKIVARLRREKNIDGFMAYVPDHGENMFDDGTGAMTHGRGHPSVFELRVPLLIWGSDLFRRDHALGWANLNALSAKESSSRSVFPTLLDALGVTDQSVSQSLLRQDPKVTPEPQFAISDVVVPVSQLPALEMISKSEKTLDP